MHYLGLIIDIVCLALILGFIAYRRWLGRDGNAQTFSLSLDENRLILRHALRQLNCKMKWSRDNDKLMVRYDFQGGHFVISLEKSNPFARLSFPFFFSTDIDRLDAVRMVSNLCNLNSDMTRVIYSINEKEGKVELHICSVMPIMKKGMKNLLESIMEDAFRWQKAFMSKFSEMENQGGGNQKTDAEKNHANYERELELVRELEMTHQTGGPDWHENDHQTMSLGSLLATTMGLNNMIPISLTLTIDGKTSQIDDPDAIIDYPVSQVLIADGQFGAVSAMGLLHFYDAGNPIKPRHLTLDFEQEEKTKDTLYYRITLTLSPVSMDSQIAEDNEEHQCRMVSVLLGYDLTPSDKRVARFRYVWKEAVGKLQNGEAGNMTPDEQLLAGLQDEHVAGNFYKGYRFYQRCRFYEALPLLRNAFNTVTHKYDMRSKKNIIMMEELAYLIGCCYMNLHQYECASYYLQMLLPTSQRLYSKAYINCMVNSGDFRAFDVLNSILGNLDNIINHRDEDDEDGEDILMGNRPNLEEIKDFANFVRRRKAYLLINMGRYDEAEHLLKLLLDDPENSDFALNELAYIQKKR